LHLAIEKTGRVNVDVQVRNGFAREEISNCLFDCVAIDNAAVPERSCGMLRWLQLSGRLSLIVERSLYWR
jgi:protein-L-isoaspartate O-methyltransferase